VFTFKSNFLKCYNIFYFFLKYTTFGNNFVNLFKNYFFSKIWFNFSLNYYYTFNCCFYNFYLENNFLFFKITDTYKNFFFLFLVKFFKKKKLKIKKKKFFKFRKKRFKFKKLRRHFKFFKFKKSKIKNEKILDLNFTYFYNYSIKIEKAKQLKLKKIKIFKDFLSNLETFSIKKIIFFKIGVYNTTKYELKFYKFFYFIKFYKFFYFIKKPGNKAYLKSIFFKKSNLKNKLKISKVGKKKKYNFILFFNWFFLKFVYFFYYSFNFSINKFICNKYTNMVYFFKNFYRSKSNKRRTFRKLRRKKFFFLVELNFLKKKNSIGIKLDTFILKN
jgi:hypothetical protein